jgi:hypothetical protein
MEYFAVNIMYCSNFEDINVWYCRGAFDNNHKYPKHIRKNLNNVLFSGVSVSKCNGFDL